MSLLPPKPGPQEWDDVVLPLFEQPDVPPPRERSGKQKDDDAKLVYRRYGSTARTSCQDCVEGGTATGRHGILNATYVRIHGDDKRYLCTQHRAERGNNEQLGR